jgi:L-fuconate dehydratase
MTGHITSLTTHDIRFPTSRGRHGSDAMNPGPDYSAAYVIIGTDSGVDGHGFAFTIGRGNDIQAAAIQALEPYVVGHSLEETVADMGELSRRMVHDSPLRWVGPEKGIMHMAIGAVINAVWDLKAKLEGKPLWQVLAGMPPEQLADLVDFRYLSDALSRDEALTILRTAQRSRARREQQLLTSGYPAYTTSPGWLGYNDTRLAQLARKALADGFGQIKLKVGADLDNDRRRLRIAREAVGPGTRMAVDANQRWDVAEAIEWIRALAPYDLWWVEEPTSPDDVLGHVSIRRAVTPIKIATGEHVHNRVMFKQLLQAQAIDVLQLDAVRVGGVNENIAILLLAAKFGVPVCPHAGGVGLCELVQHLAMFDFVAVSGTTQNRAIEYVDHLHEHFVDPVVIRSGHYMAPTTPGFSAQMRLASILRYTYPTGAAWAGAKENPGTGSVTTTRSAEITRT